MTYSAEELAEKFQIAPAGVACALPELKPSYNLAPTQLCPVVTLASPKCSERKIEPMTWGLIPPWEKEFKTKLSTINARAESLFESRLYRGPALSRRCIVPLSGFFEWKRDGKKKTPWCIRLKHAPIMSVAGVWEEWGEGESRKRSFAIVTTQANGFMSPIHDRMPVILGRESGELWLDSQIDDPKVLSQALKPCPDAWLEAYPVSNAVNSPRNNRPELLQVVVQG